MAVPARPTAGAVVESAWGQVAHDTAVAMDVQAGFSSIVLSSQISNAVHITFPRPFAAAPTVVVCPGGTGGPPTGNFYGFAGGANTTGVDLYVQQYQGVASSVTIPVAWVAYGPRA